MINYVVEHNYLTFLSFFIQITTHERSSLIISNFQIGGGKFDNFW